MPIGSDTLICAKGIAGEDLPHVLLPSRVAFKRGQGGETTRNGPFLPPHAYTRRLDDVDVSRAHGRDGLIDNWEHFDALVGCTLERTLHLNGDTRPSHALLYAEPNHNGRAERERLVELLFEKHELPAIYLARSAVLAAYANGRTTGVVLDIGHSCTSAVPVVEGSLAKGKAVRTAVGGLAVGNALHKQLASRDIRLRPLWSFRSSVTRSSDGDMILDRQIVDLETPRVTPSYAELASECVVDELKAALCRVNENPSTMTAFPAIPPVSYELPDGQNIELTSDKFLSAESTLFAKLPHLDVDPSVAATQSHVGTLMQSMEGGAAGASNMRIAASVGLHNLVMDAIHRCDATLHRDMYAGVCLTGGTSDIPGLFERLSYGLMEKYHKVRVLAATGSNERKYCAWTGGSILGTFSEFQKMWFSRSEYDENGTAFVHRKCL